MIKISIIVPVYNVERYLEKCIYSIINQTYTNIEIILVNDGSIDNSLKICNKYKEYDSRIIVIDKPNGGLSDARNVGINRASGDYIMFVDSDDWIDLNIVEKLYNLVCENDACIAQCDFVDVYDDSEISLKSEHKNITMMNSNEVLRNIYKENGIKNIVVWNKIYKKELFDNIRFPKGKIHEDEFITYKILDRCSKIVDTNEVMYYYRKRPGSITNSNFNIKKLDSIDAIKERVDYFDNKNYRELKLMAQNQLQFILRSFYLEVYKTDIANKQIYLNRILKDVKENYIRFIFNKYIGLKSKIIITIMILNKQLFIVLDKRRDNV